MAIPSLYYADRDDRIPAGIVIPHCEQSKPIMLGIKHPAKNGTDLLRLLTMWIETNSSPRI